MVPWKKSSERVVVWAALLRLFVFLIPFSIYALLVVIDSIVKFILVNFIFITNYLFKFLDRLINSISRRLPLSIVPKKP